MQRGQGLDSENFPAANLLHTKKSTSYAREAEINSKMRESS